MIVLIYILTILQIFYCFRGLLFGVCYMLLIRILIPDAARFTLLDLSMNTFCTLIVCIFWLYNIVVNGGYRKENRNFLNNFIYIFFLAHLIVALIPTQVPFSHQIGGMMQFFITQLLPIVILTTVIKDKADLHSVIRVFTVSFFICIIYGLVCFFMHFPYPYNQWFIDVFGYGRDANMEVSSNMEFGGIVGRIVGTPTADSYSFGMIVPIAFITQYSIYTYNKSRFNFLLLLMLAIGVICTTRRSPILTMLVFYISLFIFKRRQEKIKILKYFFLFVFLFMVSIYLVPSLKPIKGVFETVIFFWDDAVAARNDITGSSASFREYQFYYTLKQIKDNWLIGNGWGSMYYKDHPDMFGWESIIFTTLMQFGIFGVLLWGALFWHMYKYSAQGKSDKSISKAFIISALTLCIFTDTIYHFFIFLGAVILGKMRRLEQIK